MANSGRLARYVGEGRVEITSEPVPTCPPGGLLVEAEACGLCTGELMAWYMDRKLPHVLGHEVAGRVVQSQDDRFPIGSRVAPHHHAPCLACARCRRGHYVHCATWKETRLTPGGMAELFAVAPENLTDTHRVDDLAADDAALIEPLACVMKAIRRASPAPGESVAVIGLGFMGLLHARVLPGCTGYEPNPARAAAARALGIRVAETDIEESADVIFVLPGVQAALDRAVYLAAPGARIVLFAPWPPGQDATLPATAYFKDLTLSNAYSAGPNDTSDAVGLLRQGRVRAAQVVSHFISLDDLPAAYIAMREGRMLKAMVSFGTKASG